MHDEAIRDTMFGTEPISESLKEYKKVMIVAKYMMCSS